MKTSTTVIAAVLTAFAAQASAQEPLNKEITVDKEIVPQEREAQRLQLTPKIVRPEIQYKKLEWTPRAVPTDPVNGLRLLPPAPWEASIEPQPYRGYVAAGYLPALKLGLSAGYKLLDTEKTTSNVALQYSGMNYKGDNGYTGSIDYKHHTVTAGADINHAFSKNLVVGATVEYLHDSFSAPWMDGFVSFHLSAPFWDPGISNFTAIIDDVPTRKMNEIDGHVYMRHKVNSFSYGLAVDVEHTGFSGKKDLFEDISNTVVEAHGNLAYDFSSTSSVKATVSYTDKQCSKFTYPTSAILDNFSWPTDMAMASGATHFGLLDATLTYNITKEHFALSAGAHLSSRSGDSKGTLVYPEFRLAVMPTQQFSAYFNVGGGNVSMNSLGSIYREMPFISGQQQFSPTYENWSADAGINFGPFAGVTVELWGRYARVKNLWMPLFVDVTDRIIQPAVGFNEFSLSGTGLMAPENKYTSIHYGAAVGYKFGRVVALRVSYEGAPDSDDKGYAHWLDRAKSEFKAALTVTPVDRLNLKAAFSIRNGRKQTHAVHIGDIGDDFYPGNRDYQYFKQLGTAASLDLGASYGINKRVTVWADVENILNRRWQMCYGIMNPGVTGLVGATYKF